jgi:hypothetical protein
LKKLIKVVEEKKPLPFYCQSCSITKVYLALNLVFCKTICFQIIQNLLKFHSIWINKSTIKSWVFQFSTSKRYYYCSVVVIFSCRVIWGNPEVTVLDPTDLFQNFKTCFSQQRYGRVIDWFWEIKNVHQWELESHTWQWNNIALG